MNGPLFLSSDDKMLNLFLSIKFLSDLYNLLYVNETQYQNLRTRQSAVISYHANRKYSTLAPSNPKTKEKHYISGVCLFFLFDSAMHISQTFSPHNPTHRLYHSVECAVHFRKPAITISVGSFQAGF